jgi:hypothetical protein
MFSCVLRYEEGEGSNYESLYIIYIKMEGTVYVGQWETEESKDSCKNKK